jgi:hypothetical protein
MDAELKEVIVMQDDSMPAIQLLIKNSTTEINSYHLSLIIIHSNRRIASHSTKFHKLSHLTKVALLHLLENLKRSVPTAGIICSSSTLLSG